MKHRTYEAVFTLAAVATVLICVAGVLIDRIDWAALADLTP